MGRGCLSVLVALVVALAPGAAHAHDPFEITTDAHVSGDHMDLHTTMSLMTATRSCFKGQEALRVIAPEAFETYRPAFEECARDFYVVTSGGDVLPVRHVGVSLTVEADVDMRVSVARPTKTLLVFDAVHLKPMVARAGVVLTVTGERTFLGQEVLRPESPTFSIAIGADAEAPAPPKPAKPPLRINRYYVAFVAGLLLVMALLRLRGRFRR